MENIQFSENSRYTDRETYLTKLLIDEIESENIDEVKWLLLHRNVNPNFVLPNQGISPMHVLAGFENECFSVEVIEIALVEKSGDPNVKSADGLTPVHVAAIWGRSTVLEILLKFGGDPFILDSKCSLNAEDLALKEHQWQTHAILATFSVFNDKHAQLDDYDYLQGSVGCKQSSVNDEWFNEKLVCGNSISNNIKCQGINSDMSLNNFGCHRKNSCCQTTRTHTESISSHEGSSNLNVSGKNTKKQDNIQKKKKMSDQFAESFMKFKHIFRRASIPRLSSSNCSKDDSKGKASKMSI